MYTIIHNRLNPWGAMLADAQRLCSAPNSCSPVIQRRFVDNPFLMPTALLAAVGALLWVALAWRSAASSLPVQRIVFMVFVVGLACRLVLLFATPTFYAPDEQSHFNYIKYLYEYQQFPVQTSQTNAPTNDWEYYQPPLYYLLEVPIYAAARMAFGDSIRWIVWALRVPSVVLWGGNVLLLWGILRRLRIENRFVIAGAVSIVCLLPAYIVISSVINNDNLVVTLGGALLYLMTGALNGRRALLMGLLLGAALLTKLSAVVYVVALVALALAFVLKKQLAAAQAIARLALIGMLAALLFAAWALRNWYIYGDFTAEKVANVPKNWRSTAEAIGFTHRYLLTSFWAIAGVQNNIVFLPAVSFALTYLALIGLVYGLVAARRACWSILNTPRGPFLAAAAAAVVANLALVVRFGLLYAQGQGRLLFPMLIPLALFFALGLTYLGVERLRHAHVHIAGFFMTYALAFTGYCLASFSQL